MIRFKHFIFSLIIFLGCKDPDLPIKDYPLIFMKEIEVTDQGAKFIAEIKGLGNATIISYGFIWIENITQIEYSLSIDKTPQEGNIYAKVNTDLIEDTFCQMSQKH